MSIASDSLTDSAHGCGYQPLTVAFRRARAADAPLVFAWQQHPDTRRFARIPVPPTWDGHLDWMLRRVEKPHFWIVQHGVWPVGLLRLDPGERGLEVSIIVAPGLHNRGYGRAMLEQLKKELPRETFHAYIGGANVASGRIFQYCGFTTSFDGWWTLERQQEVAA